MQACKNAAVSTHICLVHQHLFLCNDASVLCLSSMCSWTDLNAVFVHVSQSSQGPSSRLSYTLLYEMCVHSWLHSKGCLCYFDDTVWQLECSYQSSEDSESSLTMSFLAADAGVDAVD